MATKNEDGFDMLTSREINWMMHYNELKAYVAVHHHFPDKHKVEFRGLLNWAKYIRKKIKAGTLPEEQCLLFEELAASRHLDEHTGGRKKNTCSDNGSIE